MKNFKLFISVLLVFTIISCGKDDEPQKSLSDLQGSWDLTSLEYTGVTTTSSNVTGELRTDFVGTAKEIDFVFNINEDDTYTNVGTYVVELESTLNGITTTQDVLIDNFLGTGTYEYNDPILTMNDTASPGMPAEMTVVTLSSTTLELNGTTTASETQFGVTNTSVVEYDLTFTR